MPEPFKNLLDERMVRGLGARLSAAGPAFPRARFDALALDGLGGLEMKARAMQIAGALEATLPSDFAAAADILEAAIASGLEGWALWPVG